MWPSCSATQIIAGSGSSYAQAVLFTTANGTNNFAATVLPAISGLFGDFWSGIAFGSNNTFYTEGPGTPLRLIGFNQGANTESVISSYNLLAPTGVVGPLGVDLVNGRI